MGRGHNPQLLPGVGGAVCLHCLRRTRRPGVLSLSQRTPPYPVAARTGRRGPWWKQPMAPGTRCQSSALDGQTSHPTMPGTTGKTAERPGRAPPGRPPSSTCAAMPAGCTRPPHADGREEGRSLFVEGRRFECLPGAGGAGGEGGAGRAVPSRLRFHGGRQKRAVTAKRMTRPSSSFEARSHCDNAW